MLASCNLSGWGLTGASCGSGKGRSPAKRTPATTGPYNRAMLNAALWMEARARRYKTNLA